MWYPGDMGCGAEWIDCHNGGGEDPSCSDSLNDTLLTYEDHKNYFATKAPDTRIRVAALQCLIRIVSLYYNYLDTYMKETLIAITVDAVKSPDNNVSLQGIEFWSTVCERELCFTRMEINESCYPSSVNRQFAKYALKNTVLSSLLEVSLKLEEYNDVAQKCIKLFAECARDDIVEVILPLIQDNLENPDYRSRLALSKLRNTAVQMKDNDSQKLIDQYENLYKLQQEVQNSLQNGPLKDLIENCEEISRYAIIEFCQIWASPTYQLLFI
uniref:Uncharacterized protein n=1 Tax=Panagrolaimus davidi TaxID=227884 RepID=A0A914PNN4_9BILA